MGLISAKVNIANIKKIDQERLIDLIGDFKALSCCKTPKLQETLAKICKEKYDDLFRKENATY